MYLIYLRFYWLGFYNTWGFNILKLKVFMVKIGMLQVARHFCRIKHHSKNHFHSFTATQHEKKTWSATTQNRHKLDPTDIPWLIKFTEKGLCFWSATTQNSLHLRNPLHLFESWSSAIKQASHEKPYNINCERLTDIAFPQLQVISISKMELIQNSG